MSGIQMMMLGLGGVSYPALGGNVDAISGSPTNASATLHANSAGTVSGTVSTGGGTTGLPEDYVNPTSLGAAMYVRLTTSAGSAPTSGSSVGVWLDLTADRTWTLTRTVAGIASGTWLLQFATDSGGANIVNSGTYFMTAEES